MNLAEFYNAVTGMFGIKADAETGNLTLWDNKTPVRINKERVVLPVKYNLTKEVVDQSVIYHPALEHIGVKKTAISSTLKLSVMTANMYWAITLLGSLNEIAKLTTLSVKELEHKLKQDSNDLAIKQLSNLEKLPVFDSPDISHLANLGKALSTAGDTKQIIEIILKPSDKDAGEDGLKTVIVRSKLLDNLNEAVANDVPFKYEATSSRGSTDSSKVVLSKKATKKIADVLNALLGDIVNKPISNSSVTCPSYEVLLKACYSLAKRLSKFYTDSDVVDSIAKFEEVIGEDLDAYFASPILSRMINTVAATKGNKPMVKPTPKSMDLTTGNTPVERTQSPSKTISPPKPTPPTRVLDIEAPRPSTKSSTNSFQKWLNNKYNMQSRQPMYNHPPMYNQVNHPPGPTGEPMSQMNYAIMTGQMGVVRPTNIIDI